LAASRPGRLGPSPRTRNGFSSGCRSGR
jgi:hypothetical protein